MPNSAFVWVRTMCSTLCQIVLTKHQKKYVPCFQGAYGLVGEICHIFKNSVSVAQYFKFVFGSSLPGHCEQLCAKFCWFYLLSTSNFHPFIFIPIASILVNFISHFPGYCIMPRMISFYTTSFDSLYFRSSIYPFSLQSTFCIYFFLFQIFENQELLTKTIFSFHSLMRILKMRIF